MYINATIEEVLVHIQNEIDLLRNKAEEVIPRFKELPKPPSKSDHKLNISAKSYFVNSNYYGQQEIKTVEGLDKKFMEFETSREEYLKQYKEYEESAQKVKEHNQKVSDKIKLVMEQAGVSSTYTYYGTPVGSRKRKSDWIREDAGFMKDIARYQKSFTSYASEERDLKSKTREYKDYISSVKSKVYEEEKLKIQESKKKEELHSLAALRVKYTPEDYLSDEEELSNAILSKNKYLSLAHCMESVRNDWNDGCDSVYYEVSSFNAENEEDKEMVEEILSLCDDFEDGRVFRDCKYNYSYLYNKVLELDEALFKDYQKVKLLISDY